MVGRDAPKNFGRKGFHKITTYTSTTEEFTALLPDYMHGVMGFDGVSGLNQGVVNTAFKKAVREYTVRVMSKKKVIAFSLLANADTTLADKPFKRATLGLYGDKGENSTGLAIWYCVCWETKADDPSGKYSQVRKVKYVTLDTGYRVSSPYHGVVINAIDYTPEAEVFFEELSDAIALLTLNAEEFLNKTEKLLELIANQGLLPFMEKKEQ